MKVVLKLVIAIILLAGFQGALASVVIAEKDGLTLAVELIEEKSGILVSCVLSNNADSPICTTSILYRQAFYVSLVDAEGSELPQIESWAEEHAQKSSRAYRQPTSSVGFQVDSGESVSWSFRLDSAYARDSIQQARKIEVSWESHYPGAKRDLDGEPYRFPPTWAISVRAPLVDDGAEQSGVESGVTNGSDLSVAGRANTASNHQVPSNNDQWLPRWNGLILIGLAILLILYVLCQVKIKKGKTRS